MAMRGPARFIRHRATRGLSSMLIRRSISQTSSFRSLFQSNTMNTRPRHVETEDQIKGMMGGITFTDVAIDGQGYRFANLLCISGQPSSTPAQPDSAEQCEPAHKPVKHLGSTLRITRFPASSFEQTTSLIGPWLRGRTGPSAMHRGTGTGGSNPTCSSGESTNFRFLSRRCPLKRTRAS